MPANKKYLTTSNWSKLGKITAALFGGFSSVTAFHLALASVLNASVIWGMGVVTTFILWGGFTLWVYWVRVAWKAWLFALTIVGISASIIFLSKV